MVINGQAGEISTLSRMLNGLPEQARVIADRTRDAGDVQYVVGFANGYGASIIRGPYTYGGPNGLFGLGVIVLDQAGSPSWHLTYETPVTSDVLGYLTVGEVAEVLAQIQALPARRA